MSQDTEAPIGAPTTHIYDTLSTKIIKSSNEIQGTEKVGINYLFSNIQMKAKSFNERD